MKKSKFIFLYDKEFIDLLNLIKELIKQRVIPSNIKTSDYQANLFEETFKLDYEKDENIIDEIIKVSSQEIFNTIYKIFLSNKENKEIIIFYFLLQGFKYKNKIFYMRNLKGVNEALRIAKYVEHETHKFKGFLRFKELKGNVLYAEIEPENNILFFLSKHFQNRLKNEYWIIEDKKRKLLSIYDKKSFFITSAESFVLMNKELSECEEDIEELWKNFYKTIAIKERTNSRCRMNFMPKKYWKYIIEMSDEIETNN